jgi:hypothetical protein
MRRCHLPSITFPIVMGVLLFAPSAAIACTCDVSFRTRAEVRKDIAGTLQISNAVFLGEVIAVDQFKAVLKVKKIWKGDLSSEVTMTTGVFDNGDGTILYAGCIISRWEVGKHYVVFAVPHLGSDLLKADTCGPTTSMPSGQATTAVLDEIAPIESRDKRLF